MPRLRLLLTSLPQCHLRVVTAAASPLPPPYLTAASSPPPPFQVSSLFRVLDAFKLSHLLRLASSPPLRLTSAATSSSCLVALPACPTSVAASSPHPPFRRASLSSSPHCRSASPPLLSPLLTSTVASLPHPPLLRRTPPPHPPRLTATAPHHRRCLLSSLCIHCCICLPLPHLAFASASTFSSTSHLNCLCLAAG